jgi:hypothetical protein
MQRSGVRATARTTRTRVFSRSQPIRVRHAQRLSQEHGPCALDQFSNLRTGLFTCAQSAFTFAMSGWES